MWIAWPAFLTAALLEILVFAFVDPSDLNWFGARLNMSRLGVYTLTFFVFWCLTMISSALTVQLSLSAAELNEVEGQAGSGA